jgi:hypothetical protein
VRELQRGTSNSTGDSFFLYRAFLPRYLGISPPGEHQPGILPKKPRGSTPRQRDGTPRAGALHLRAVQRRSSRARPAIDRRSSPRATRGAATSSSARHRLGIGSSSDRSSSDRTVSPSDLHRLVIGSPALRPLPRGLVIGFIDSSSDRHRIVIGSSSARQLRVRFLEGSFPARSPRVPRNHPGGATPRRHSAAQRPHPAAHRPAAHDRAARAASDVTTKARRRHDEGSARAKRESSERSAAVTRAGKRRIHYGRPLGSFTKQT